MKKLFEGIIAESTCGNRKLGEEIHLFCDGKAIARMVNDSPESRELALFMTTLLNDAQGNGTRPSKLVLQDRRERYDDNVTRNAEHIAKTITLNMTECQHKFDWLMNLKQVNGPESKRARQMAAEMYGCRQFVTGVIRGRLHQEAEGHIDSQVAKWEEMWDAAFGDVVGQTLGMQE